MTLDGIYLFDSINGSFKKELRPNTEDVTKTENSKFQDFKLSNELLRAIYDIGFKYPSPIQKDVIPEILKGHHILARAKNGTGKTAAFAIPSIQRIQADLAAVQVMVIVPSRELALQTFNVFKSLTATSKIGLVLCIGGTSVNNNLSQAQNAQILVGTPGRIKHLTSIEPDLFAHCATCIIDEADVMLSNHFVSAIFDILFCTPSSRQILLFSATFPLSVKSFSDQLMPNAVKISTMESLTLNGVTSFYIYLDESEKLNALFYLLSNLSINQSIIFVNSVKRAELLFSHLAKRKVECACIHSKMNQEERIAIYNSFKGGNFRHLVSTNIFTRGIDIPTVNVVINFDFPSAVETYLHRVGRSGRFGQLGLSIEMVTDSDKINFYKMEDYLSINIEKIPNEIPHKLYN